MGLGIQGSEVRDRIAREASCDIPAIESMLVEEVVETCAHFHGLTHRDLVAFALPLRRPMI